MNRKPLIIGHRGAAGLAPENTLISVETALRLGVHRIEIDIHQTYDHKIVVIHDDTTNRTTDIKGQIKKMTYDQLSKANAAKLFPHFSFQKVPLLEEVIDLVNGKVPIHLELKHSYRKYPGIENRIHRIIKDFNAFDWIYVNSFDNVVLRRFHQINPNIVLHKLLVFNAGIFQRDKYVSAGRLQRFHFVTEFGVSYKYVTPLLVQKIHRMNKKINVWTVNEPRQMLRMALMNVDGIITDFPDRALELFYPSTRAGH